MISFIISIIFAIVTFLHKVESCSCLPSHPQQSFCGADFVIRAKVVKRKEFEQYKTFYTLKNVKVFRDKYNLKTFKRIQTASNGALCGKYLILKKYYLLSGYLDLESGVPSISLCGFNQRWRDLTYFQRKSVKKEYPKNCNCQIKLNEMLMTKDEKVLLQTQSCFYDFESVKCKEMYSHCEKNYLTPGCHWSKSKKYKKCLKKMENDMTEGYLNSMNPYNPNILLNTIEH